MVKYTGVMKMGQLSELRACMYEVEEASDFKGYWFRISDLLLIVVCGMLCALENMSEIYDWAIAKPVRAFLAEQIGIVEIP